MNARTESRNSSCSSSNRVRSMAATVTRWPGGDGARQARRRGRDHRAVRVGGRPGAGGPGGGQPHPQRGLGGVGAGRAARAAMRPSSTWTASPRHPERMDAAAGARRRRRGRRLRPTRSGGRASRVAARCASFVDPRAPPDGASAGRSARTWSRRRGPRVAPASPSRSRRAAPPRRPSRGATGSSPDLVMELNRTDVRADRPTRSSSAGASAGEAADGLLAGRLRRAVPHRRAGPRLHRTPAT